MTSSESLIRVLTGIPWPRAGCISATALMLTQYHSSMPWGELLKLYSGMTILVALPLAAEAVVGKIRAKTLPLLALASILSLGMTAVARAEVPTVQFDIQAGDASRTLPEFIRQSKLDVGYLVTAVSGVQTNAIEGTFTVDDALEQMLQSTDLEPRFEEGREFAWIVRRAKLPERVAQRSGERDGGEDVPQVIVTGTLIRSVVDIMSPLETITKKDMKKTAYATVQDAMEMLPLASAPGPREDIADADNLDRGASANLRSLGPDATLVLVNGKRQPLSGVRGTYVDLANIPASIIDRIEVLPDGASALYGADAVAGVVNVITRTSFEGSETHARFSAPRGGGEGFAASQLFGRAWDTGNAVVAYEYSEQAKLRAMERWYAANADKRPLGGSDYRTTVVGNIFDPITLLPVFGIPTEADGKILTVADLRPDLINVQNQYASVELLPSRRMHSGYVSATQKWGDRVELRAEGRFTERTMTLSVLPDNRVLEVPESNAHFIEPFFGAPFVLVGYGFGADLGPAIGRSSTSVRTGSVEVRAKLTDRWETTLSHSRGALRTEYADYNRPDPLQLAAALRDSDPARAFNPFTGSSQQNAAILEAIRSVRAQGTSSKVFTTTLLADGPVLEFPAGTMNLALGSELREEEFEDRFTRRVESMFAEIALPLVGASDGSRRPRLDLSLAARAEHYDDLGTTFNPKVGLRWAPAQGLHVRTTWSKSFKAPRLVDTGPSVRDVNLLVNLADPVSPTGRSIVLARQGSNPSLRPEIATTWTAGADLTPALWPNFTAAVTFYDVRYVDRVILPGPLSPFDVLVEESQWQDIVDREFSREAVESICVEGQFQGSLAQCLFEPIDVIVDFRARNMGSIRARGFDFGVKHSFASRLGQFETTLKSNYVTAFERKLSSTAPSENLADTAGNPLRLRMRGSLDWSMNGTAATGLHVGLAANYAGSYEDMQRATKTPVRAMTTVDLWASYRMRPGTSFGDVELTMGVVNVFDEPPPFLDRAIGYDVVHADPLGRVAVVGVHKMW